MAHANYRMKGPCDLCSKMSFVGVCPHGQAVRIDQEPLTPEAIEEALKKGAKGAAELDKKLAQVFRPPNPAEDLYLRRNNAR